MLNRLKELFNLPWLQSAADASACSPAELIFKRFRRVLQVNNRALTIIADLGEKLSGDYIFDQQYIIRSTETLTETVAESLAALNILTGNKYQDLDPVFQKLTSRLQAIIARREDRHGPQLIALDKVTTIDWAIVGGKNAHLAEMAHDPQILVADGFVITTCAYHELIDANNLREDLDRFELMMAAPTVAAADLDALRQRLERGVLAAEPPPGLLNGLTATIKEMGGTDDEEPFFLAVRSSAQEEDMDFSFAGQFHTELNVAAVADAVFDAYRKVAASLFGAKAIRYRRQMFPEDGQMSIAAGCQRMIDSRAAGVVYTVEPDAPASDHLVIVGAWGQGEAVVEGSTPTDTFIVAKQAPWEVVEQSVADKANGIYLADSAGLVEKSVPSALRSKPCLEQQQLQELARQAVHLENYYKRPQDIEWAVATDGTLFILQCRSLLLSEPSGEQRGLPKLLDQYQVLSDDSGRVAQQGIGSGPVVVINNPADLENFPDGGVLVSRRDSSRFIAVMHRAVAIVTEVGTPVSHMATLCRELRVPCLVGVDNILSKLTPGEVITVDAEDRRIYHGRVTELLTYQATNSMNLAVSYEFRLLRRLLQAVSRLYLVDPLMQDFTPAGCKTYHDILRFSHEMAVAQLVDVGRDEKSLRKHHLARHLDLPIPAGIMVIDLDGGIAPDAPVDQVPFTAITSLPFRAILQGMLFPDVWHRKTMPVGMKDLMSSMLNAPSDALSGQYSGHNIAIISKEYVNLCFRFGYHFNIIDAHCSERERDNHIYFRFLGGATDMTKRSRRSRMIAAILDAFEFNVSTRGDLVIARAGNMVQSEMERTLDIMGRLVGFTRQLDVCLDNDAIVDQYVEAFLSGDYGIVNL